MPSSSTSLTIIASLVDDVSAKAARISKAIGSISNAAKTNNSATVAATKSTSSYTQALGLLEKNLKSSHEALLDWSASIQNKVTKVAKDATLAVAALGVGILTLGASAANQWQRTVLDISTFGGGMSMSSAAGLANQLRQSQTGKLGLGVLTGGYQQLLAAGMTGPSGVKLAGSLANISATRQDPAGTYESLSDAVGRISQMGVLDSRSSRSLVNAGVPIYQMLAQHLGIADYQVRRALEGGNPMYAPWLVGSLTSLSDPLLKGFQGGVTAANTKTLGGSLGFVKLSVANAISDVLTGGGGGKGGTGGPARSLTADIAGLGPAAAKMIQQAGPEVMAFVAGLGKYLPAWAKAGRDILTSLKPLVPAFQNFTTAFAKLGPVALSDLATLFSVVSATAQDISVVMKYLADNPLLGHAVTDFFVGVFGALALYKTVAGITTFVQGFIASIKALQLVLAGQTAASGAAGAAGAAGATAQMAAGRAAIAAGGVASPGAAALPMAAGLLAAGYAGNLAGKAIDKAVGFKPTHHSTGFFGLVGKGSLTDTHTYTSSWNDIAGLFGAKKHKSKMPVHSTDGTDSLTPQSVPVQINNTIHVPANANPNAVRGAVQQGTVDALNSVARDQAARGHVNFVGVR